VWSCYRICSLRKGPIGGIRSAPARRSYDGKRDGGMVMRKGAYWYAVRPADAVHQHPFLVFDAQGRLDDRMESCGLHSPVLY